jgi:hypothetical protein
MLFLWFVISGMVAIAVDRRLVPAAVGFAAGFGVAVAYPTWVWYAMSASNFAFMLNAAWNWRPATIRPTSEEMARYQRD